jgi:hypothetical protein
MYKAAEFKEDQLKYHEVRLKHCLIGGNNILKHVGTFAEIHRA